MSAQSPSHPKHARRPTATAMREPPRMQVSNSRINGLREPPMPRSHLAGVSLSISAPHFRSQLSTAANGRAQIHFVDAACATTGGKAALANSIHNTPPASWRARGPAPDPVSGQDQDRARIAMRCLMTSWLGTERRQTRSGMAHSGSDGGTSSPDSSFMESLFLSTSS